MDMRIINIAAELKQKIDAQRKPLGDNYILEESEQTTHSKNGLYNKLADTGYKCQTHTKTTSHITKKNITTFYYTQKGVNYEHEAKTHLYANRMSFHNGRIRSINPN